MLDSTKLMKMTQIDSNGKIQTLHSSFTKANGRFCDSRGMLVAAKVRHVYMMAGLLSPATDMRADLLSSINNNIVLLNAYLEHASISLVGYT
jgi:hypothetical protein